MNSIEIAKKQACIAALSKHLTRSVRTVGIGSGSTIKYIPEILREMIQTQGFQIEACVPTSFQSRQLILEMGLPLGDLNQFPKIDVTFDGADEVDDRGNLIKGGGACHLQEKLVAASSEKLVIVADESKSSSILGTKWNKGVPIEAIPLGYVSVMNALKVFGGNPVLREAKNKAGPVISDNGNFIIDCDFGLVNDPSSLDTRLNGIVGLVEHGLFCKMTHAVYFGKADGTCIEKLVN